MKSLESWEVTAPAMLVITVTETVRSGLSHELAMMQIEVPRHPLEILIESGLVLAHHQTLNLGDEFHRTST